MGKFDGIIILTDLDGTLLNRDGEISYENKVAVKYFMDNGGLFSIATGRSKAGMEHFLEHFPINAPAVIFNGSAIYDFENNTVIDSLSVGDNGALLAQFIIDNFPQVGIEVNEIDQPYVLQTSPIVRRHMDYVKVKHIERTIADIPQPWLSMLLCINADEMPALKSSVESNFPDKFFLQYSATQYLEVQHPLSSKGWGAHALCKHLGISYDHLYTVGDGLNDIQLITCTENGYSPANAHKDILAMSPKLLPSNDEHCIAALINIIDRLHS